MNLEQVFDVHLPCKIENATNINVNLDVDHIYNV